MCEAKKQESIWEGAEIIFSYTRAQAIEDGVLIDLSGPFPVDTRVFKHPVACTSAVWTLIEDAHEKSGQGYDATVWDICFMAVNCQIKQIDPSTVLFRVGIPLGGKEHTLKIVCGPGDDGKPVMTIMLPYED
ncbi:MAG: DUF6573 family protein [Syntrophaceae bacterium]